jgi:diguanylate cyclase (GGDEF)-like protein/PAS domain S-box-containing protein
MADLQNKKSRKFIVIFVICSLILFVSELLISQYVSTEFSRLMYRQRESSVSKMARLSYNAIRPVLYDLNSGKINKETARIRISSMVRNMTYEDEYGKNYIFMSTYDGFMLVQPFEPQKEGSSQWDLKDSNGQYIIRELVKAAKEKPKGSFVAYHYYLPEQDSIEEKLSYVIGIPEIDAYIGTGMYMDSSYKELKKTLELQRYGLLFMSIFIFISAVLSISTLLKSNRSLTKEIRERMYAESNIRTVFDSIHDAVIIHDRKGKIILSNKRAGFLYGIQENEMSKYNLSQLSSDEYDPDIILIQSDKIKNSSMVFEWKCKRPTEDILFDGEVALRNSKWSGEDVIVAVIRDISDRKKQEEEIRHLAYYDYLTSLHNRVSIISELNRELTGERSGKSKGAVLFIDLDNFKKINDSLGHFFGDEVLIQLADRLLKLAKDRFIPARIGGDEFVILCFNAGLPQASEISEEILEAFREPIILDDNIINITCSLGIALYPKDGGTVEDIFKNADMALYSAKYKGKDNYIFYEDAMSTEMQYKTEMERQLRQAYRNQEFILYYQPLFDIGKEQIIGYEALLRWDSAQHGIVTPDRIIPLAEEIGFIDKIGDWVIEETFAFAKDIQTRCPGDYYISCNVSPVQLSQNNFVDHVIQKFERFGLKKDSVAFEITESCLIESFDEVKEKLTLLRKKGILIYLDDFGTGYSSLNYLKNLPVDYIKIDKSFIDDIAKTGIDSRILKTIITLAHELGLKTVAEGVETTEQFLFLKSCQCDFIQGYLISKPKPEQEVRNELEFNQA